MVGPYGFLVGSVVPPKMTMEVSTMAAPWKARQGGVGAAAMVVVMSVEAVAVARRRRRVRWDLDCRCRCLSGVDSHVVEVIR